jgi:hypothetical protein
MYLPWLLEQYNNKKDWSYLSWSVLTLAPWTRQQLKGLVLFVASGNQAILVGIFALGVLALAPWAIQQ